MILSSHQPDLQRQLRDGIAWWTDPVLCESGVVVAFSERSGGVSEPPYMSLNLAGHVGDAPAAVDANRDRFLDALDLGGYRGRLVTAEQVHGSRVAAVDAGHAGFGAYVAGTPAVSGYDALLTDTPALPLMLCFADCVPVILVAGRSVAVVHAGWRGALANIVASAVAELAAMTRGAPSTIRAYVGAHIGACHYQVDCEILSQFVNTFDTVARAESGGLDLGAVVTMSLRSAGVDPCNIACLGVCTAETTDRFFSHRAEAGLTGRHAALACIHS